jgi:shikimate kinase
MDFAVFGVPAAVLIVVLVEFAKKYGLDSRWAPVAALIFGQLLAVLNQLSGVVPGFEAWYKVVIAGLLAGLTACGMYSGQKALRGQ